MCAAFPSVDSLTLPLTLPLSKDARQEVGEAENDRERRKKDKRTVGILTLNSHNPCNLPFRTCRYNASLW